jgi:iron(III) transport system ATP-binding protein
MRRDVTGSSDIVIRLANVTKSYGRIKAVDDVSFDLHQGEILTLLGPSGCGKTTTLRLAVGLERCDAGEVLDGHRRLDAPAKGIFVPPNRRDMGMVFQSYAIWPHMTVAENVAYPLRVRGTRAREIAEAVDRMLALVGLDGFQDRAATQLSGGQQQRVAVARALIANPEVLLLDEPFSNLDAKLREQMRTEVKVLQRRLGIPVLFVTHDQTEALSLSDRIAVMRKGRIEQIGPPQALYADPQTAAVRDFLGRTLKFAGRLVDTSGGEHLVELASGRRLRTSGGLRGGRLAVNDECIVAVRPEFAAPASADARNGAENHLPARLSALLFLGDHYEASLELGDGEPLLIRLPASGTWREGEAIMLAFPPERLQLWPKSES